MLKHFGLFFLMAAVAVVAVAGFRGQRSKQPPIEIFPDMDRQAKVKAQEPSGFYADGAATRPPVPGTVPMGYAMPSVEEGSAGPYEEIFFGNAADYFDTGRIGSDWGTGIPFEVTPEVLTRGRERFNITCAVCHGETGSGNGIVSKYGLVAIANLHDRRLVDMADGEIFQTITRGKNTMEGYGDRIQIPDRWAIIAYLRALQRAQRATLSDVPPEEKSALEKEVGNE